MNFPWDTSRWCILFNHQLFFVLRKPTSVVCLLWILQKSFYRKPKLYNCNTQVSCLWPQDIIYGENCTISFILQTLKARPSCPLFSWLYPTSSINAIYCTANQAQHNSSLLFLDAYLIRIIIAFSFYDIVLLHS